MAATTEGARLTELHRLLQVRLSTQAMAATRLLWSTLDPVDLDRARDVWLKQQLQLMKVYDQKSALAAADYMKKFRVAEGFSGGPIEAVDGFDRDWAESSLGYNGPGAIGAGTAAGATPEAAKQAALSQFLASAQRIALGGGRRVMDQSSLANPDSNGWRRVSDGSPCAFCAMLVSRGNAYRSAKTAGRGRHWHRRCGCTVEEVFGEWEPSGRDKEFVEAYDAAAANLDAEGKPHTEGNVLGKMRESGKFRDSPQRRAERPKPAEPMPSVNLDAPVEKTQLTGSFAPKPAAVEKTQLSGSFEPKPAPIVKTQLTGSFAPKKPEKTQLTGSFAPKPAPAAAKVSASASNAAKPAPKLITLADFKVAPKKPIAEVKKAADTPPPKAKPKPKPPAPTSVAPEVGERDARDRRRFKNDTEGKTWASKVWPGPNGYNAEELRALRSYTGEGYTRTNNALRKSKGARGGSRGMDKAMNTAPRVPEDVVVARGTTAAQFGLPKGSNLSKLVGKDFTEHGYLSTSVDSRGRLANEVTMKLTVPKGHKAIYVSGNEKGAGVISVQGGSEAELILNRGTKFRITSAKRVNGKWQVEADIIG